jgi:hypothetical protein
MIESVFIIFLILSFLIYFNFYKIKRGYELYNIFKKIVDPQNNKNCCTIFYDIFVLGYKICFPKQLNKFNKKHVKIPYEFREQQFYYLLKMPRGILPIQTILDENNNNIMNDIYPYLGPNLDCHGSDVFPKDFGLKKIFIKDGNNKEYTFTEDEQIKLN